MTATPTTWTVLTQAHEALRTVAAAAAEQDRWDAPTPCQEWTVAQVLTHATGDQRAYAAALTGAGGPTEDPFAPSNEKPADAVAEVRAATEASAAAFAEVTPGAEAVANPLPQGPMSAELAVGAAAMDAAVHAWDVAMALGAPSPLTAELAAALLPTAHALVEPLRAWGVYAPVVAGATGDPADELLRFLGRDPEWAAEAMTAITPATVAIPQADLDDLADRLARTRWANEIEGSGTEYGTSVAQVREWAEYWRTTFDWRAVEARLNAYPQFTTEIDGQRIHFLHVRSLRPDATALILTHGWPGSVLEYLDVIDPLVAAGFDLVIPSLPGFGFSGPTTERGWGVHRVAAAWVKLMDRLGYDRYGAVGNDAGSMISPEVGRLAPEAVIGVHVTQLFSFPSGDPAELADLTPAEQAAMERLTWFWENLGAFNVLQSQSPQTLAHALADSPVGLLGWNGQLLVGLDPEFVVANVALYWLTGTSGSSIRMYREMAADPRPAGPTTTPTALAAGAKDFLPIRRFADRDHSAIERWNVFDVPGHYTAHEAPQVIVDDVTAFFADVTAAAPQAG